MVRVLFGPAVDGAFGMTGPHFFRVAVAVAAAALWVARIPLSEDSPAVAAAGWLTLARCLTFSAVAELAVVFAE